MVVIDTHVLVWWVSGDKSLSIPASAAIKDALANDSEVVVSSISAWEIAMLIEIGRLTLTMDLDSWLGEVAEIDGVRFMPVDNEIAVKSTMLPDKFHKDPADRMIVATARKLAVPLITADDKIRAYEHVQTVW